MGKGVTSAFERDAAPMIERLMRNDLMPAMNQATKDQLRPAIQSWIRQDLNPAIRQIVSEMAADALIIPTRPEVAPAVVQNARNVSKGGSYGARDFAIETGIITPTGGLTTGMKILGLCVFGLFGLIAFAAVVILIVSVMSFSILRKLRLRLASER
jgi:hypothetical protein